MSDKFEDIISQVEKLSVMELADLVKKMEEKFGISAAMPVAAAGAAGGGDEGGAKDAYDVSLNDAGSQKIQVIKVLREALGLGLKEAKDMAEGAPVVVKAGVKKEEADALKQQLMDAGAVVELK